jgi:hypothetical protein
LAGYADNPGLSPRIETPNRSLLRKARFLSSGLLPSSRDPARIGDKCEQESATSQSRAFGQRAEPARLNPDRCTIKQAATAAQKKRRAVSVHAFRCSVHWAKAEGDEISARWLSRNGDEFQVICRYGVALYILDVESPRRFSGAFVHNLQALLSARKKVIFSPLAQGDDYREQLAALLG